MFTYDIILRTIHVDAAHIKVVNLNVEEMNILKETKNSVRGPK
jgi:hypothetical protein